ncbi:MAG: tRNA pseudouridine(38-40) synthase TruA [Burkholderiaceae bacterium]|nr:tRNA pseudouridine(38-40) synthase TruA [Burkholderiaceae bacterium]
MRVALGLSYRGTNYHGWQIQPEVPTVQSRVDQAIRSFMAAEASAVVVDGLTVCAGRTDAGVHARLQVVHFDCAVKRKPFSWVRGVNTHLPPDIRVQWAVEVDAQFDARRSATRRRYEYRLLRSPVAPALASGLAGWTFERLDVESMRSAAQHWIGRYDFSSFRSSECQAKSPIREVHRIDLREHGPWLVFNFEANAFLHHMVRNMMGALIAVGTGRKSSDWARELLMKRDRRFGAPTFMADGLYLAAVEYANHPAVNALSWQPSVDGLIP